MSSEDTRTASLKQPINLTEYLYQRLHQIGIRSVYGVPGDYNLAALDYLEPCGLSWVGNANELGAAYAADGDARVRGISALITTFGVGELSALNGIAGSYAEYVPVLHIVGTPSTVSAKNGMVLHHTLGNGDFKVFTKMSSNISCAVAELNDPSTATALIDHAIKECYLQSRPAYITLPMDLVTAKVEGEALKTPLDLSYPKNEKEKEDYCVQDVMRYINQAKKIVILVDACASRHRALKEVHELVRTSGLPTFVTPLGKGAVDETLPNFGGVYAGDASNKGVREIVESSDLVLSIGSIKSDLNTAAFSYRISNLSTIDFHSNRVQVKWSTYTDTRMNGVLTKITQQMKRTNIEKVSTHDVPPQSTEKQSDDIIRHDWLWPHFSSFFEDRDIILSETGTSANGIYDTRFKSETIGVSQVLWGSIGYAFGATMGAVNAAKETGRGRTILFTGEGSLQLTIQELGTIIRHKLTPIIFIIENGGYTIERLIHGMDAVYNDIGMWDYCKLPAAMGAQEGDYKTYDIKTKQQLLDLLQDKEFATGNILRWVVVHMPRDDGPGPLKKSLAATKKMNAEMK